MTAVDLADRLRLARRGPGRWAGDCPACAYPRAFALKAGATGRPLLYCANGCTREQLHAAAGAPARTPAQAPRPTPNRRDAALRLWASTAPCPGTPAEAYLQSRALPGLVVAPTLRFRADCPHPGSGALAAMVALVQDASGAEAGVHRTYLTRAGAKAGVDPVRASLGPIWGGAVRLAPAAAHLVLGEGIETAGSAGVLLGLPAWAALSAGNLARGVRLPPEVRQVTLAVDPDAPGLAAAEQASLRFGAEGRRVAFAVPGAAHDFNDVLQACQATEAPHA